MLFLERETHQNYFHFMLSLMSRGGFQQKLENVVKNYLTVILNAGSKLFTLNQVVDEFNCLEHPCVTFPGIFCKKNQREVIVNFAERAQC